MYRVERGSARLHSSVENDPETLGNEWIRCVCFMESEIITGNKAEESIGPRSFKVRMGMFYCACDWWLLWTLCELLKPLTTMDISRSLNTFTGMQSALIYDAHHDHDVAPFYFRII